MRRPTQVTHCWQQPFKQTGPDNQRMSLYVDRQSPWHSNSCPSQLAPQLGWFWHSRSSALLR